MVLSQECQSTGTKRVLMPTEDRQKALTNNGDLGTVKAFQGRLGVIPIPSLSATRRQRQEDEKCKVILAYSRLRPGCATRDSVSDKTKQITEF